jgi:hypothetical protein
MYEYRKPISRVILTSVITVLVIATSILPLTQRNAKAFSLLDAFKNLFKKIYLHHNNNHLQDPYLLLTTLVLHQENVTNHYGIMSIIRLDYK